MRIGRTPLLLLLTTLAVPVALHAQDHDAMQHADPPSEGLRAEMIADIGQLEEKYMGLAEAMSGHLDWRPAEGVRSAAELFGHVANGNFMIPSMAGAEREMADTNFEQEEPAAILEGLEHSFMHARHAIADVSDDELDDEVQMFGQPATKRQVLLLLVTHMHEHLGQAIAYARSNGVTPPWSQGG
jgi:uncharacterized damage-inducible protein DinB